MDGWVLVDSKREERGNKQWEGVRQGNINSGREERGGGMNSGREEVGVQYTWSLASSLV